MTGFVNSSFPNTMSAVHMALAFLVDPRTPKNSGAFRPVKVITREGTVVHPRPPAPVTLATNHCAQEIAEAMIKALGRSCPDRVLAGWSRRFRIAIKGVNPRTKRPFIWHMFHARGGGGACSVGDGWETAGEGQAVGGIKFGSVEVAEVRFPLTFVEHEFRPDSGGDGQHRDGVGSILRLRVDITEPFAGAATVVKRGSEGCVVYPIDAPSFEVPSMPIASVVDTTGAGDAFAAGFLGVPDWARNLHGAAAAGHAAAHELLLERAVPR